MKRIGNLVIGNPYSMCDEGNFTYELRAGKWDPPKKSGPCICAVIVQKRRRAKGGGSREFHMALSPMAMYAIRTGLDNLVLALEQGQLKDFCPSYYDAPSENGVD